MMKNSSIKSITMFFSCLMMFVSSAQYSQTNSRDVSQDKHFSFETFNKFQGKLMDIGKLEIPQKASRLELNNEILRQVNEINGTEINYTNDFKKLKSSEEIFDWLVSNTDFNERDVDLFKTFSKDLTSKKFETAIKNLEFSLSEENISIDKFNKYESIVNGIKLIEYQYPGSFTAQVTTKSWGCAFALAKLALAVAGLAVGCNPATATATVGVGCYLAATNFIASSISVGLACDD